MPLSRVVIRPIGGRTSSVTGVGYSVEIDGQRILGVTGVHVEMDTQRCTRVLVQLIAQAVDLEVNALAETRGASPRGAD